MTGFANLGSPPQYQAEVIMPQFSKRRLLKQQLRIFDMTGQTMYLIMRANPSDIRTGYTPGNLFASTADPLEDDPNNPIVTRAVKGKFEETNVEQYDDVGRKRVVKGIVTIPMLYKSYLAQAEYIDPYGDGSRFKKTGAIVDEERLFCTQSIESVTLATTADVE
jgi:hypothetical protein